MQLGFIALKYPNLDPSLVVKCPTVFLRSW